MSSGLRLCSGLLASSEALTVGLRQYMVWMEANNTQFKGDNGAAGDYIILVMLIRILRDLQCVSVESNHDDDGDGDDDDGDAVDDDKDGAPDDDHERLVMRQ